ncbi:hypothetical protein BV898_16883 [Hypsibius exemplaris]|uniref:DNA-directed DNA polymerase n=1 Tax=Hypsibius exemplaris TaxID=2072580 RepID=A0A9X6NGW7_HYPEX|nr:hypothetical protein BV898_16883 [Hypsibius exemplaris]
MKAPYTLADLPKFEAVLPGYQITVLSFTNGKGITYKKRGHRETTNAAPAQQSLRRLYFNCSLLWKELLVPNCDKETFCKNCKTHVIPGDHQCYIMPIKFSSAQRKKHRETEFLYFDLETFTSADGTLIPNLAVVQNGFGECVYFPKANEPIERDISDELCKFLISPQFHNCIAIAHNFSGFDGMFILKWCLANGIISQKQIMNGTKIMQMDIFNPILGINLRIRCSYRQISLKLIEFPAALELKDMSKGDFPHRFNRSENWNRVTPFLSKDDFGYRGLSAKDKIYFDQWYAGEKQAKDGRYDFNAELRDYCKRDVDVLREGCQECREIFMEISGGICPFNAGLTIASLCSVIWRFKFLEENLVGLVPKFAGNRKQSHRARQWLEWKAHLENDTIHPIPQIPYDNIYQDTKERTQYLRDQGCDVEEVWEHDFKRMLKDNKEMQTCIKGLVFEEQLVPRDAFSEAEPTP